MSTTPIVNHPHGASRQDTTSLFWQNLVVIGWDKLGKDVPAFEPYFAIPINADPQSGRFFPSSDKYNNFSEKWIKETFPNGLPPMDGGIRTYDVPGSFYYRICWMPSYTIMPYRGEHPQLCSDILFMDYDSNLRTQWQPTLIAVPSEEQYSSQVYIWDVSKHWVVSPFPAPVRRLLMDGMDISNKKDLSPEMFREFSDLIDGYLCKNLFPSWWDWNY